MKSKIFFLILFIIFSGVFLVGCTTQSPPPIHVLSSSFNDSSAGMTDTRIFNDSVVKNTVVIKNGLITNWTQV